MREILLKAASHIESRPNDYCFMSVALPSPSLTAGCALGWLAYFSMSPGPIQSVALDLGCNSEQEFYDRLDSYNPGHRWGETWTTSAQVCANALRAYAAEFFPG